MRVHLDTDIGGDTDDVCALALLLGDAGAELTGITTVMDGVGRRADCARYLLRIAGRNDVPVASGAGGFLGGDPGPQETQDDRYWPRIGTTSRPPAGEALELLEANASAGATIIAIGPFTNLALLEALRPGVFANCRVVVMGGYTGPPAPGLPQWEARWDYNVQTDRAAARIVYERIRPVVVPLGICLEASIRRTDLDRLRKGGPVARFIAHQSELHRETWNMADQTVDYPRVPRDILNFQYDPIACATAIGWDCTTVTPERLALAEEDGCLRFVPGEDGPARSFLTGLDARAFEARWLATVERIRRAGER